MIGKYVKSAAFLGNIFAEIKSSQSYLKEDEYLQDCVLNFMVAGR